MIKEVLLTSNESDNNLIVCLPRISEYSFYAAKYGYRVRSLFTRAQFSTAYLNDTTLCVAADRATGEYSKVISIDYKTSEVRTNKGMLDYTPSVLHSSHLQIPLVASLCFDWIADAVKARGRQAMIMMVSECCCDTIDRDVFLRTRRDIAGNTKLPIFDNPWSFGNSPINKNSLNAVKSFAAMVSLCFFYAGPHCIHSQIAALMGVPTFIFQENLNDNRISVGSTTRAFPSAKFILGKKHGSDLISKAYKYWRKFNSSIG